ncbi:uncharacterized protein LOC112088157 isoform X2 [Eutrema salsugineum]|uniref:uncharacterized protein LOC112088157 isoform X2 n=1 Tax=Eutrema salsugineum TaxID=72664 RepID=UPI000CED08E7|nr:uncharacterized protein LOC112088157 isoform X2 [Eutrema salsugineum]
MESRNAIWLGYGECSGNRFRSRRRQWCRVCSCQVELERRSPTQIPAEFPNFSKGQHFAQVPTTRRMMTTMEMAKLIIQMTVITIWRDQMQQGKITTLWRIRKNSITWRRIMVNKCPMVESMTKLFLMMEMQNMRRSRKQMILGESSKTQRKECPEETTPNGNMEGEEFFASPEESSAQYGLKVSTPTRKRMREEVEPTEPIIDKFMSGPVKLVCGPGALQKLQADYEEEDEAAFHLIHDLGGTVGPNPPATP